jgi:site-specific DNA-methyltransferase (adenine-specific)
MSATATVDDVLAGRARWCVVCGERDEVLAAMGDAAVDVTLTDPPYNERTHKGARVKGGVLQRETTVKFADLDGFGWWPESLRVTRRWCLAFCAAEHLGAYEAVSARLWVRAGIWVKPRAAPQFTGDRPGTGAEGIAIAHRGGRKRWNGGGSAALWTHGFERDEVGAARVHETQKPLRLMRALVRDFSDPGDVILDPHAGSGTTGLAAILEGRRVILVERDPVHAATCVKRMEASEPGEGSRQAKQLALFARK